MPDPIPLPDLTVAMIARDAADQVDGALQTVRALAGRIVVLDTGSTDTTAEIARASAEVHQLDAFSGFGAARRAALSLCTSEWVFFLDADERVSAALAGSIRTVIGSGASGNGWRVRRQNHILGRRMRSMGLDRDQPLRLFRRTHGRITDRLVHEGVQVEGPVGLLEGDLDHFTLPSLDAYLRKIDHYTTLDLEQAPRPLRRWHLAFVGPGTFVKWYWWRGGWRDGVPGLVWAGLTAISRFMLDMKMWIRAQQTGGQAKGSPTGDPR